MTMSAEELSNACTRIAKLARASSTGCTLAHDDVSALEEAARVLSAIAGVRSETADRLDKIAKAKVASCGSSWLSEEDREAARAAASQLRVAEVARAEMERQIELLKNQRDCAKQRADVLLDEANGRMHEQNKALDALATARAETIEAAAKECDLEQERAKQRGDHWQAQVAKWCAKHVRALLNSEEKAKSSEDPPPRRILEQWVRRHVEEHRPPPLMGKKGVGYG